MIASVPFSSVKRVTRKAVNKGKLKFQVDRTKKMGFGLVVAKTLEEWEKLTHKDFENLPDPRIKTMQ